jgi:hypothetical protein
MPHTFCNLELVNDLMHCKLSFLSAESATQQSPEWRLQSSRNPG